MKLPVLALGEGAAWEERLVAAFARESHPVTVVRRCVDVVDLIAVAATGQGRVALVGASARRFDADAADRLRTAGVAVVIVVARGDARAEERCRALGVDAVLPDDAESAVAASVLAEAVRGRGDRDGPPHAFADPSLSLPMPTADSPPSAVAAPERRGSVIAVWGPTGAPGRTTVALGLADEIAQLGLSTLLVDADVYGGTVAAATGLLDESPGLAAACRQAGEQRLDAAALAALSWQLGPKLRVLTGIPLAARWPELRPAGVQAVLAAARGLADFTVIDCGFCLETDEELSFDTIAPRRNGATLAVLDEADLVLVIGSADPIGVQRLVRGLADFRDAGIEAPVRLVLNRVCDRAVPGDVHAELTGTVERFTGTSPFAMLPADPAALDAAIASGRMLREASPTGPLRRSVVDLAVTLTGVPERARRGRRRHGVR